MKKLAIIGFLGVGSKLLRGYRTRIQSAACIVGADAICINNDSCNMGARVFAVNKAVHHKLANNNISNTYTIAFFIERKHIGHPLFAKRGNLPYAPTKLLLQTSRSSYRSVSARRRMTSVRYTGATSRMVFFFPMSIIAARLNPYSPVTGSRDQSLEALSSSSSSRESQGWLSRAARISRLFFGQFWSISMI